MSLVGKRVVVTFVPGRWPVGRATYVYEGYDETGHWLRRKDGVQRHMDYGDVATVKLAEPEEPEIPEPEY